MIVIIRGGLGNQMFQLAHAKALENRFGARAEYADFTGDAPTRRDWQRSCFGGEPAASSWVSRQIMLAQILTSAKMQSYAALNVGRVMHDDVQWKSNSPPALVSGYWQRPSVFEGVKAKILDTFAFPTVREWDLLPTSKSSNSVRVAIHVRRGDYATNIVARERHLVCDANWYLSAWKWMQNNIPQCRAVVFSDDIQWVRDNINFGSTAVYLEPCTNEAWIDMARMSLCDHFIISNSSYSWWAAYLGRATEKIVVAPKFWFRGVETASIGICPKEWLLH